MGTFKAVSLSFLLVWMWESKLSHSFRYIFKITCLKKVNELIKFVMLFVICYFSICSMKQEMYLEKRLKIRKYNIVLISNDSLITHVPQRGNVFEFFQANINIWDRLRLNLNIFQLQKLFFSKNASIYWHCKQRQQYRNNISTVRATEIIYLTANCYFQDIQLLFQRSWDAI